MSENVHSGRGLGHVTTAPVGEEMAVAAGGTEAYWLCCCTCRRSSSARVALMVSNCGHVHCSGCRRRYGDGTAQCDVCRQSAMFLAVDNKIQV